jgi:carbonic anhydrase
VQNLISSFFTPQNYIRKIDFLQVNVIFLLNRVLFKFHYFPVNFHSTMKEYEKLLEANRNWATGKLKTDPDFFERLLHVQTPKFLWIGCSDSRVPANEITGTQPGEIFVHRNVANLVINTDVNLLSVLDYAVSILKVHHVIVCGHYGCGGIRAALTQTDYKAVLNMWLRNIKDVYRLHRDELDRLDNENRDDRLVELNVQEQILNLSKTSIIQRAWKREQRPHLHGWVYGLKNGLIKPVCEMKAGSEIDPLYQFDDL